MALTGRVRERCGISEPGTGVPHPAKHPKRKEYQHEKSTFPPRDPRDHCYAAVKIQQPADPEILFKHIIHLKKTGYGIRKVFCFTDYKKFSFVDNECVDSIENWEQYVEVNGLFYNCKARGLKYFDYNCYESCSEIYGEEKDDNSYECETCESKGKIFYNNKCEEKCEEEGYGEINMSINNITYSFCQKCIITGKYYYDHQCYDECLEKQVYNSENICHYCKNNTFYDIYPFKLMLNK